MAPFGAFATSRLDGFFQAETDGGSVKEANRPKEFSAAVSGSGSHSDPTSPDTPTAVTWGASATAYADLGKGTLGAFSNASTFTEYGFPRQGQSVRAYARAAMWDTVTIANTGLSLGVIPLQLDLDGGTRGNVKGKQGSSATANLYILDLDRDEPVLNLTQSTQDTRLVLDASFLAMPGEERRYQIGYGLSVSSSIGYDALGPASTTADYLHTLRLR